MTDLTRVTDWLREAGEIEANTPITAGGMLAFLPRGLTRQRWLSWESLALGKLVALRRRPFRLSLEQLASKAGVELRDVKLIERGGNNRQDGTTIRKITLALELPENRLLELAGLAQAKSIRISEGAVRFAARSESNEELCPKELAALEEYMKELAEL